LETGITISVRQIIWIEIFSKMLID